MVSYKITLKNTAVSLAHENGHDDTVAILQEYSAVLI